MSNTIDLHSFGKYDRSGKVRWLAAELGISVTDHKVELGAHRKSPYRDLNPYAVIPTAVYKDQVLIESSAICTYLAEQHPEAGLVVATNEPERASYLQWMAVVNNSLEAKLVEYYLSDAGLYPPETKILYQKELDFKLKVLVKQMPESGFLVADRFTLADISLCYSLRLAIMAGLIEFNQVESYLAPFMEFEGADQAEFFKSFIKYLEKRKD